MVANQHMIREELKSISDNACYDSVQNLLSSPLLSRYVQMQNCNFACSSVWV
jgi:hypothetical protein